MLNGFGADELFGGYFSHQIFYILSEKIKKNTKSMIVDFKKYFSKILKNPNLRNIDYLVRIEKL